MTEERSFGGHAFYAVHETADRRHVALGGVEHEFVGTLLTALDRADLIAVALGPPGPGQHPVKAFLAEAFRSRSRDAWEAWSVGRDLCFAPVPDLQEVFARPQVAARQMILRDGAGNPQIGTPIRYRNEPGQVSFDLPDLDAHRAELLGPRR